MKIELDKRFAKKLESKFQKYEFEVGILADSLHKDPQEHKIHEPPNLTSYAGGPIRKMQRQSSGTPVSEVLLDNMKRLNKNILLAPFLESSSDIIKFSNAFLSMVFGKPAQKRVENLLQAIVRNPILRGDYGPQSAVTADMKGFERPLIDTGQMFKAIKARVKVK